MNRYSTHLYFKELLLTLSVPYFQRCIHAIFKDLVSECGNIRGV